MFSRKCPECNKNMEYSSKGALTDANKKKRRCKRCVGLARIGSPNMKIGLKGKDNNMFGKHHSEETKRKMVENRDYTSYKTKEFSDNMSKMNSGVNNPMYGKKVYDIWVEKFGKEEADNKQRLSNEKKSKRALGSGNPMYGKPTPKKAGNGWCGWYKDWFFRSLRELTYMIKVIEENGLSWVSGETIRIKYIDHKGSDRTYSPDFIVDNQYMVEIKPLRLHTSSEVLVKKESAIKYCETNNLEYVLIDIEVISVAEIENLLLKNLVKFTDKTMEKYLKYKG